MNQPTQTVHATTYFPIINPPGSIDDQRKKVMEELDEFMDEIRIGSSLEDMAAELNDVYQAFITLVYMTHLKEYTNTSYAIYDTIQFIEDANKEHRAKIERYKAERGWT